MNILFYLHQFPAIGGIETVTATLANYFVRKGHAVAIVSHRAVPNADKTVALDSAVRVLHMPGEERISAGNRRFLQKTIAELSVNLVIFQDSYAEIEKNLFVDNCRVPKITCEHNSPFCDFGARFLRRPLPTRILWHLRHPFWKWRKMHFEKERRRFLYERSDAYVLLSTRFFGEFRAVTQLADTRKLRVIPNPIAGQLVAPVVEKENIVLFCGSLNPLKGCDMLMEVWRRIAPKHPDWRLVIVGDGSERPKLEAMASSLPNVTFEGYKADPAPYFAKAKIFAFPSRREGWGLVLVEAMANGCVPVAFNSYSSVYDIVEDGRNGFVVPAFDLDKYGQRLEALMSDNAQLLTLKASALDTPSQFDIATVGHAWDALISEIYEGAGLESNAR